MIHGRVNQDAGVKRMETAFDKKVFHGCLIRGDVEDAMRYLTRFPEQAQLRRKYIAVFEEERYPDLEADSRLQGILRVYQKYYRNVFYLCMDAERAEEAMKDEFVRLFHMDDSDASFCDIEEREISAAFRSSGYHFLGGRTGGYWGPYIWKTTESRTYDVALPGGRQPYTVRFLDGFISKGWCDFISFGEIGTGGWTDGDGIIHCVKASYDLESESFTVSLLKHEAQHARDLSRHRDMSSGDLEYRAKLVELIYSSERNLLQSFIHEADASKADNGHALAANRIIEGFAKAQRTDGRPLDALRIPEIQAIAKVLLADSDEEIRRKYVETE